MKSEEIEIFKPIPGYEGLYEISNKCRIKSLPKEVKRSKFGSIKFPETFKAMNKSNQVCLFKEKKREYFCIKKLYLLVFENLAKDDIKYQAFTFERGVPTLTTHRKVVADTKLKIENKKCKFTGVTMNSSKSCNIFQSSIMIKRRRIHLGYYSSEEEAGLMYKKAAENSHLYKGVAKLFREMLNFIHLDN